MTKDFLSLFDFTGPEIMAFLHRAVELKALKKKGLLPKPLAGQVWGLVFEKASARTRVSFETGIMLLGGGTIFMAPDQVQFGKRETLEDAARVLSRYLNGLVVRTYAHQTARTLAKWASIPIINGLSDFSHPCQVLADLQTILEKRGSLEGVKVAWVGDGNNMARSWLAGASRLGFHLTLACPEGYFPGDDILERARALNPNIFLTTDPAKAVQEAEVVNTDVWASMGQEHEAEVRRRVFRPFQVNEALLAQAPAEVFVMHCLPAHRGEEITHEVLEGPRSVVFDQAENRLWAQMAVLEALGGQVR